MTPVRGMTLVELMVGLTLGLFLVAGAGSLMGAQLHEQRRLQLELQVQQDVRAIGSLIRRELGTAGAWAEPERGAWTESAGRGSANPYAGFDIDTETGALLFAASQAAFDNETPENHRVDDADRKALRLRGATLEFRTDGGRFQPLNDPGTVAIRRFEARTEQTEHPLEAVCARPCDGWTDCPPRLTVRTWVLTLDAEAATDARVTQSWSWRQRLSADTVSGSCRP